jgi:hypothetical protein
MGLGSKTKKHVQPFYSIIKDSIQQKTRSNKLTTRTQTQLEYENKRLSQMTISSEISHVSVVVFVDSIDHSERS